MKKNRAYFIFVCLLIVSLAACNLSPAATSVVGQDAGATAVAQTVEAFIQQATLTNSATESSVPATAIPITAVPVTITPAAIATLPAATNTPGGATGQVCDNAQFVSETIPDGTIEPGGASFVKKWQLKNIGTCTWNSSYAIVFLNGDALGAPSVVSLSGNTAPGETISMAVNMQAPTAPGNYTGNWTLRNAAGVLFGLGKSGGPFWIKISVAAPTATSNGLTLSAAAVSQALNQVSLPASASGQALATCPAGSILTGGGFAGSSSIAVYSNFASGNTWQADAKNLSASAKGLNAYAECLSNTGGTTQQVVAQVNVAANDTGQAVATCPAGSVVTGGGFASNSNLTVYSSLENGNGWEVNAQNTASLSQPLNAYVLCLSGTSGTSQQVLNQATVAANVNGNAVAACPGSTLLTGGGFASSNGLFVYTESASSSGWQVYVQNNAGASKLLNAYAICLTLP
jgi:hypothetical protein